MHFPTWYNTQISILIENTPWSMTMPEGAGTFAVWAHNRFPAYDRPKYYCTWGRQIRTSQCGTFIRNWIFLILYQPFTRLYIYFNCSRRKANIVSHLLPVSVWSIVSREIILLPAELIPLPEEANRSRPRLGVYFDEYECVDPNPCVFPNDFV